MNTLQFYGLEDIYRIEPIPNTKYSKLSHNKHSEIFTIFEDESELRDSLVFLFNHYKDYAIPEERLPLYSFRITLALCHIIPPQNEDLVFQVPDNPLKVYMRGEGGVIVDSISAASSPNLRNLHFFAQRFKRPYLAWLSKHFGNVDYDKFWSFPLSAEYVHTEKVKLPFPLQPLSTLTEEGFEHPIFDKLRGTNFNFYREIFKLFNEGTIQNAVRFLLLDK